MSTGMGNGISSGTDFDVAGEDAYFAGIVALLDRQEIRHETRPPGAGNAP
jgi:hypothetical protein